MAADGAAPSASPSRWEWLPVLLLPVPAAVCLTAAPGAAAGRFAFWVGLALIPGVVWRLLGHASWRVHRACFAFGLLCFMATDARLRPDAAGLARILRNWPLVLLGLAFCLSQPFWGALRIGLLLNDSMGAVSIPHCLRLCLVGNFFNIFLPGATGGDAYRVYAISGGERRGFAPALAAVTLDRFLGLPPLVCIILAASLLDAGFFGSALSARLGTFVAAAAGIALLLTVFLLSGRRAALDGGAPEADRHPVWGRFRRFRRLLARNLAGKRTLPLAFLHGLASHIAVVFACMLFGRTAGVEGVSALRHFLVVPLAMAVNSIPGAPGGLGQGELAMAALLDLAAPGMGNAQAGVLAMLLLRCGNILAGLAGGCVFAASGGGSPFAEAKRLRRFETDA
ncbi:MAG: flippase-like domain-containing protein [Planctomycetota bacterium]|jgi:uncharacterized protein (TIRG00374 family)|nr:flippase-like domain-containing protein [Planctomycetota bacterium]